MLDRRITAVPFLFGALRYPFGPRAVGQGTRNRDPADTIRLGQAPRMCGIAGAVGGATPPPDRIRRALDGIRQRGPDHQGWRPVKSGQENAVLLATRLGLVDLDPRSNQPFTDGINTLVYNGELYNHLEVRRDLEAEGEVFRTSGDTEVMLKVLACWGIDGLSRCDGMWAFAFHEGRSGALWLCRDRFGEKPLFHWAPPGAESPGRVFGSEVKALAALAGRWPGISYDQVMRGIVNGYRALFTDPCRGYFEDVEEVRPGSAIRLAPDGSVAEVRRYWEPPMPAPEADLSFEAAVEEGRELLARTARSRLRGDVPGTILLSGGIDSNTLLGLASASLDRPPATISVGDLGAEYDERTDIEAAVAAIGCEHEWVDIDRSDFLANLIDQVTYNCAPVATVTYYIHGMMLQQVGRSGRRLVLSGVGADEIFSGYYDHHNAYLADLRTDPGTRAVVHDAWAKRTRCLLRNPLLRDADLYVDGTDLGAVFHHPPSATARYLRRDWSEPYRAHEFGSGVLLRERMLNELFHESVPVILREEDQSAMRFSVENRAPYLSPALLDFSARLPTSFLIRDGIAKAILREIGRPVMPDRIASRVEKIGFNSRLDVMVDRHADDIADLMSGDNPLGEFIDTKSLIDDWRAGDKGVDQRVLWGAMNGVIFADRFHGRTEPSA